MTVNFEPAWAVEAVDDAYGTVGLPLPMRLKGHGGKPAKLDAPSVATLSGALEAIANLNPENLLETAEVPVDGGSIRVSVEAPESEVG